MNKRITQIRKSEGLTQELFAEKIGISKNYVNLIENGKKQPGNRLLEDICRKFNVNLDWLLNGNGKMKEERSKNQEIIDFANEIMESVDDDFKKRFILALTKLDERDWETIRKIVGNLSAENKED